MSQKCPKFRFFLTDVYFIVRVKTNEICPEFPRIFGVLRINLTKVSKRQRKFLKIG